MKKSNCISVAVLSLILLFAVSSLNAQVDNSTNAGTLIDERDGHEYKWVEIGNQIWMAENLAYRPASGNYWPSDNESYVETYGYLYDWRTAIKVCPSGWHLPHTKEWDELKDYLASYQGRKVKEAGTSHWKAPNKEATNESGFSALPGGMAVSDMIIAVGIEGRWWSCTFIIKDGATVAWCEKLSFDNGYFWDQDTDESLGFSVRCVKDF